MTPQERIEEAHGLWEISVTRALAMVTERIRTLARDAILPQIQIALAEERAAFVQWVAISKDALGDAAIASGLDDVRAALERKSPSCNDKGQHIVRIDPEDAKRDPGTCLCGAVVYYFPEDAEKPITPKMSSPFLARWPGVDDSHLIEPRSTPIAHGESRVWCVNCRALAPEALGQKCRAATVAVPTQVVKDMGRLPIAALADAARTHSEDLERSRCATPDCDHFPIEHAVNPKDGNRRTGTCQAQTGDEDGCSCQGYVFAGDKGPR